MINMLKRILPVLGLKNITSDDMIKKGLEKVNPMFKGFFSEAGKYGYPLGAAIGFLQSEFGGGQGKQNDTLRPDEQANIELQRQNKLPQRLASTAANVAGGAALGGLGGAALSGIGSALGNQGAQQSAQPQGYDPLAGLSDFPELTKFIQDEYARGGNAQSIASKARKSVRLGTYVNTIEQTANEPFENLLSRLLGSGRQPQQSQQQPSQQSGDDALLAALDKILKM